MMFTDIAHDKPAYVQWLVSTHQPLELAYRAFDLISEHLTVGNAFQLAMQAMEPKTLAMLIANNHNGGEFAQEVFGDKAWRQHCNQTCDDPNVTMAGYEVAG